ncbi:MAG: hypothetical protein KDK70_17135 [Myxococcales bacterium]|nr:hypothetical protein [Myxococcales bacterium]
MPVLPVRCDWTHFAPSVETVELDYDPPAEGELVSVRLEVRDFAGTLVHRSAELDCAEGPAQVRWTGAIEQGNDANHEPFATPLRSPYTLEIHATLAPDEPVLAPVLVDMPVGGIVGCDQPVHHQAPPPVQDDMPPPVPDEGPPPPPPALSVQLAVLYHSVEVVRGPWEATTTVHGRTTPAGLCHRLNQLGYYAGPPARAGGTPDLLDKAKERFRRNHGDLRQIAVPSAAQFADALDQAIVGGTGRPTLCTDDEQPIAEGTALPTAGGPALRVYLEAVGFDEDLMNRTDEFMQQIPADRNHPDFSACANKTTSEAGKLNRPMIPLEAVVYLKRHDDARAAAPRAVGDVRVDWRATGVGEDTSRLPFADRLHDGTRTYIERLFKSERVDLQHDGNTNCPALYGGIRTANNDHRNPFWREAEPYAPYARPTDDDGARAVWVPAYTDHGANPARVGRSGVYLRPSLIAGDHYRLSATLSFAGRANADALAQANPGMRYVARPLAVWRRVEVFAIVGWPTRAYGGLTAKCRQRYADAYTTVDFTNTNFTAISHAIDHNDYAAWFQHVRQLKPSVQHVVGVIDTTHVHDEGPIVFLAPDPALGDEAQAGLFGFASEMLGELVFADGVPSAGGFLMARISNRLRVGHPCGGVIFLEYRFSDPVRAKLEQIGGDAPTVSNGNANLMGIIDQAVNADANYVFTHELAHCFWLTHHEASSGVVREHHDQYDHNCVMSYPYWGPHQPPYPHHLPDRYDPTFCGKCNLKLRGWDITHDHILGLDAPQPPDALTLLLYYDRADPGLRWAEEIRTVRGGFTSVSRGPYRERFFDRNAVFETWRRDLGDCDVYHHISHGNVRCSRHGSRLASMDMATPRYPTWCRSDATKVQRLSDQEAQICHEHAFDADRLTEWAGTLIVPSSWWHSLRSVIQWTVDDLDSSRDIEFTYEQIEHALGHGTAAPRRLAFFSSCLLGWERRFAKLFIDHGTPHVIAFRSRYETAQALEFSELFYRAWTATRFAAVDVTTAFLSAAVARPHAEPCLFTAAQIVRAYARTMAPNSGDVEILRWNDDGFYRPRFPQRG